MPRYIIRRLLWGVLLLILVSALMFVFFRILPTGDPARLPLWAPEYWLGLIVLSLFAADIGQVHVFPGAGSYVGLTADTGKWLGSLILPWLVVAAGTAAVYARLIRGSLIETMGEDYIRTARAKGLSERRVVLRHCLRSANKPIWTILWPDIGVLLGSSGALERGF